MPPVPREYTLKSFRTPVELNIDYKAELNAQQFAAVSASPGPALVLAPALVVAAATAVVLARAQTPAAKSPSCPRGGGPSSNTSPPGASTASPVWGTQERHTRSGPSKRPSHPRGGASRNTPGRRTSPGPPCTHSHQACRAPCRCSTAKASRTRLTLLLAAVVAEVVENLQAQLPLAGTSRRSPLTASP